MVADGQRWVYDVVEGPIGEGFATGYNRQPRGEAVALGAQLHGRHRDSEATLQLGIGVWREKGNHMCDPFANMVGFSPADRASRMKLRPGDIASETCPSPEEGVGGLSVDLNLTEAAFDEETGSLHVTGTFSGPLGRGAGGDAGQRGTFRRHAALVRRASVTIARQGWWSPLRARQREIPSGLPEVAWWLGRSEPSGRKGLL